MAPLILKGLKEFLVAHLFFETVLRKEGGGGRDEGLLSPVRKAVA